MMQVENRIRIYSNEVLNYDRTNSLIEGVAT